MSTLVVLYKKISCSSVGLLICLLFQSVEGEDIQRHRSCHQLLDRFHKPAHNLGSMLSGSSPSKDSFSRAAGSMSSERLKKKWWEVKDYYKADTTSYL